LAGLALQVAQLTDQKACLCSSKMPPGAALARRALGADTVGVHVDVGGARACRAKRAEEGASRLDAALALMGAGRGAV
jgi:hypothetical protein